MRPLLSFRAEFSSQAFQNVRLAKGIGSLILGNMCKQSTQASKGPRNVTGQWKDASKKWLMYSSS
jgi:hypothetical protein